nr:tRNA (adenosine(37)-N6)-threonylcarbamoyltransferase complex ATPase subunit type 1 TsaE [Desulfobulbaceae bacterium]
MRNLSLENLDQTNLFGLHLAELARPGDIYTLTGTLGAGKTTLTQFIGRGLGVPENCYITSPTFSLIHEYQGRIPLFHMDLYRLASEEIFELGFEEYLYGEGLTIIEWPDRLGELMPEDRLEIVLDFASETARTARLTPHGSFTKRQLAHL